MNISTKEPEMIFGSRAIPNMFFYMHIEDCPKAIPLAFNVADDEYVKATGNLFQLTQNIMVGNRSYLLQNYPRKSMAMLEEWLSGLNAILGDSFKTLDIVPRKADGPTKKITFLIEANQGALVIKFSNIHMEDVIKLCKVYREVAESNKGIVAFLGPHSVESKLDNPANRLVRVFDSGMKRLIERTYSVFRG